MVNRMRSYRVYLYMKNKQEIKRIIQSLEKALKDKECKTITTFKVKGNNLRMHTFKFNTFNLILTYKRTGDRRGGKVYLHKQDYLPFKLKPQPWLKVAAFKFTEDDYLSNLGINTRKNNYVKMYNRPLFDSLMKKALKLKL